MNSSLIYLEIIIILNFFENLRFFLAKPLNGHNETTARYDLAKISPPLPYATPNKVSLLGQFSQTWTWTTQKYGSKYIAAKNNC